MAQLGPDAIRILPSNATRRKGKNYSVIFITGNPGLIGYYRKFLTHLHAVLSTGDSTAEFTVRGSSLVGFEIEHGKRAWKGLGIGHDAPFNLAEVIDAAERNVMRCVEGDGDRGVILVGHSVGAYIALEIIQRHRRRLEDGKGRGQGKEPRIVGGICLFPTVVDIGKSEKGVMLTVSSPWESRCCPSKTSWLSQLWGFSVARSVIL
jgi:pimeloyl-ACP methyl ester carboxylesterase